MLESGEAVVQETRHWDEQAGRTYSLRSKEEAYDYRYFPEPDLVPVAPSAEWRERVRAAMPELPAARKARLIEAWGISDLDAGVLVGSAGLADYAEAAVAAGAPGSGRDVTNWVTGDLLGFIKESGAEWSLPLPPKIRAAVMPRKQQASASAVLLQLQSFP